MNLHCPHCGVKGSADDSYSGRTVKCPKCDGKFALTLESAVDLSGDASSVLSNGSISLDCPECGVSGTAEGSFKGKSVRCPKCAAIFTAGEELVAEVAAETVVDVAPATPETVVAAIAEESFDEPAMAGEAVAEVVEEVRPEPAELAALEDKGVIPDAGETVSDFELSPEEVAEPVEIEELEEVPAVEEIEIVAAEEEPFEILELDEEAVPPTLADEEVEPKLEEPQLVAEEQESPETLIPPPAPESIEVPAAAIEQTPYGVDSEECWQCGKKDSTGQPFTTMEGRMYCVDCVPVKEVTEAEPPLEEPVAAAGFVGQEPGAEEFAADSHQHDVPYNSFSIGEALREAWTHTSGAKGTIWKGSVLMYLSILVVVAVGSFLLPSQGPGAPEVTGWIGGAIFQAAGDAVSVIFTAGLLFMGIRRVAGDPIYWRMVFSGFSCAGKIIIATILQSILISIGILLLVLPGIYLAVGYAMALPLIVDRGMSPWEAMETSRKAIHKIWWKIAGLLLFMGLITIVSMIPLGIGLIWTWPMFIVLAGVIYRYLFGTKESGE